MILQRHQGPYSVRLCLSVTFPPSLFMCSLAKTICTGKAIILLRLLLIICCRQDKIHGMHITINKNTPKITMPYITKRLSHTLKPRLLSHENIPHQSPSLCCCSCLVNCLRLLILLWMDSEWSLKFMQHMPSNSSHLWPWANSKKSMAALFCSVACRTELTSISVADRHALVVMP